MIPKILKTPKIPKIPKAHKIPMILNIPSILPPSKSPSPVSIVCMKGAGALLATSSGRQNRHRNRSPYR